MWEEHLNTPPPNNSLNQKVEPNNNPKLKPQVLLNNCNPRRRLKMTMMMTKTKKCQVLTTQQSIPIYKCQVK
jgi:hypothetical protein